MDNLHHKLIAKVQHFYDVLAERALHNSIHGISSVSHEVSSRALAIHKELCEITNDFKNVFKDILYLDEDDVEEVLE